MKAFEESHSHDGLQYEKRISDVDTLNIVTLEKVTSSDFEDDDIKEARHLVHNRLDPPPSSPRSAIQQQLSSLPLSSASSDHSSSISSAPNWSYGPIFNGQTSSRNLSSGLCQSERGQILVAQPELIQNSLFPTSDNLKDKIIAYRNRLTNILTRDVVSVTSNYQNPLLIITGPSFVQDAYQIKACAQWVGKLIGKDFNNLPDKSLLPDSVAKCYHREKLIMNDNLMLGIRLNLSKYNIDYDDFPLSEVHSIMTFEIEHGIPICRALLCELAEICPIVGEASDTITPQYFSDLFCLGLVSSTLIESQLHRELASGVSYSIGFSTLDSTLSFNQSMYKYKIQSALDAIHASSQQHQFLSVTKIGTVAVVGTVGNHETFIILQVNLQLSLNELKGLIKVIYDHPRHKFINPKIMLDVGKVLLSEYQSKLEILTEMLTLAETKFKIIGVMIDSGDHYIPKGYQIDLTEKKIEFISEANDHEDFEELLKSQGLNRNKHKKSLYTLNQYFVKNRKYKNLLKRRAKDQNSALPSSAACENHSLAHENLQELYEYFINADRMIQELGRLSDERIIVSAQ